MNNINTCTIIYQTSILDAKELYVWWMNKLLSNNNFNNGHSLTSVLADVIKHMIYSNKVQLKPNNLISFVISLFTFSYL